MNGEYSPACPRNSAATPNRLAGIRAGVFLAIVPGMLFGFAGFARGQTDGSASADDVAAEAELRSVVGEGFRVHRTARFLMVSDADDEVILPLLPKFESTYDRVIKFCASSGFVPVLPQHRLQCIFFRRYDDFCAYAQKLGYGCQNLTGFFFSQDNRMVFYDIGDDPSLADLRDEISQIEKRIERRSRDEASRREFADLLAQDEALLRKLSTRRDQQADRLNRLTVQHELSHQVLYNVGVHVIGARNPGWLVEGLACLFESPVQAGEEKAVTMNAWRREDLRLALAPSGGSKSQSILQRYQDALQNGSMIPLRQLVGDAQLFSRREEPHLVQRYAQAWSFVYFLQQRKREGLAAYLQIVSQRKVGEETDAVRELGDFETAFGPLDERFEKQWLSFAGGLIP